MLSKRCIAAWKNALLWEWGREESSGIIISVYVGFRYIPKLTWSSTKVNFKSKKFSSRSSFWISFVNETFLCKLLNFANNSSISSKEPSMIKNRSSMYLAYIRIFFLRGELELKKFLLMSSQKFLLIYQLAGYPWLDLLVASIIFG